MDKGTKIILLIAFICVLLMLISLGHDFFSSKKASTQQTGLSSVSTLDR